MLCIQMYGVREGEAQGWRPEGLGLRQQASDSGFLSDSVSSYADGEYEYLFQKVAEKVHKLRHMRVQEAEDVAQSIECLPGMHEVLHSDLQVW